MVDLPRLPGTYALHLYLPERAILAVGRLGRCDFPAGDYVYVGSAFGPGGLHARLSRHVSGGQRQHWHIDSLRPLCTVGGYCYSTGGVRLECDWHRRISALPGATSPAAGFGASDCRSGCGSHLVHLAGAVTTAAIAAALQAGTALPVTCASPPA